MMAVLFNQTRLYFDLQIVGEYHFRQLCKQNNSKRGRDF